MSSLRLGYYSEASVVLIQAISPLHVGIGRGLGVVDLPVQRDALGFPTIFASSLKGPLRATFDRLVGEKDCTNIIFGPSDGRDEDYYAGAFNPLDAKLLLLPVRSLIGVHTLCTCPLMLNNFLVYLESSIHAGANEQGLKGLLEAVKSVLTNIKEHPLSKEETLVSEGVKEKLSLKIAGRDTVIFADEFRLSLRESPAIGELSNRLEPDEGWRFAVVHDDFMVNSLLERSLLRQTRVALDTETKKVKRGALWTEEDLPPQTILYTVFFYSDPRTKTSICQELRLKSNASGVKELFEKTILPNGHGYMIFGGHETVGRGVAKLRKVG